MHRPFRSSATVVRRLRGSPTPKAPGRSRGSVGELVTTASRPVVKVLERFVESEPMLVLRRVEGIATEAMSHERR